MANVRAKSSFRAEGMLVRKGDIFDSKDPIVKGRENLFESPMDAVRTTARGAASVPRGDVGTPAPSPAKKTAKKAAPKTKKKAAATTSED